MLFGVTGEEVHEKLAGDKSLQIILGQTLKDLLCAIKTCRLDFIDMRDQEII